MKKIRSLFRQVGRHASGRQVGRHASGLIVAGLLLLIGRHASGQVNTNLVACVYSAQNFYSISTTPQGFTNPITIQPWPQSMVGVVATNFVPGPAQTFTPNTNGLATFYLFPNQYRLTWPGLPYGVLFSITTTTNVVNLASVITSGAGVYWGTNNFAYLVQGAPGDAVPGALSQKLATTAPLSFTTNTVGGGYVVTLVVNATNAWAGSFTGTATNAYGLQATNVAPNSGVFDPSLMPGWLWYLHNYFVSIVPTNLSYLYWTNIPGNSTPAVLLGGSGTINVGCPYAGEYSTVGAEIDGGTNDVIWGGYTNRIFSPVQWAFIVGGSNNNVGYSTGSPSWSGIIGGYRNWQYGFASVVLGGYSNNCFGTDAVILGGSQNSIGSGGTYSTVAGQAAVANYANCWDWNGSTNNAYPPTAAGQVIWSGATGFFINTNGALSNALVEVNGTVDATNFTLLGVPLTTVFNSTSLSNGLSANFNYALNTVSNQFVASLASNTAALLVQSNQLVTASNSLAGSLVIVSNLVTGGKAFTLTVPSGYLNIGAAFSAPYMPDGNYEVSACPEDYTTAAALAGGLDHYYVTSKTTAGFTFNLLFATNQNLNFDIIVREHSQ